MLTDLQRPAEEHPSRPRSNSVLNAEIERMIVELRTRDEEHQARMAEIRHSTQFFEADADLFRRAGVLGSREAIRLQSMSRNAAAPTTPASAPLTPAGKAFMEHLPAVAENDFPDETSCGICMDPYGSTDDPESRARLPCGHLMGRNCIERWLQTCNTCPLCRHVLFEQDNPEESPAFLELQELLQSLGPEVTRLFVRMMDHVRDHAMRWDTLLDADSPLAGLVPELLAQEAAPSIEDFITSLRPRTPFETDPPQAAMTHADPEEAATAAPSGTEDDVLESFWSEVDDLGHLQAMLELRTADYNSDVANGLLGPETRMELRRLIADAAALNVRLDAFRLRQLEMVETHGVSLSRQQEMMEMHGISL